MQVSAALKGGLRPVTLEAVSPVPEPTALVYGLLLCGAIGLWGLRQRRMREAGLV